MDRDQLFERIKLCIESKNYPSALMQLRRELEANPDDPQILFWLGLCLAEIGEWTEAEQYLKQAASLDPSSRDVQQILDVVRQKQSGEEDPRSLAANYFNLEEPVEYKKKECPNCHRRVGVESWQCGYCHQLFWRRILVQFGIFFACASLFLFITRGWFFGVMGIEYQPAVVVDKAKENGGVVQVSKAEWNCIGLGLTQARGTGFNATVRGTIKNTGEHTIEKANITVFFQSAKGMEITFVWFDVFTWKSGQVIDFEFPGIYPPSRPERCEIRVESVQLVASEPVGDAPTEFYFPSSSHFPSYRFAQGETVLAERMYGRYKSADPWSWKQFFRTYGEIIPAAIFSYLCIILAVFLTNYCDPERVWNSEWRLDIIASAFVVVGFIVINTLTNVMLGVIGFIGLFVRVFSLLGFGAKLYLFYLFFRRSFGYTVLMIFFYVCLSLAGLGLWSNIAGHSRQPIAPPSMEHNGGVGGMGGMGGMMQPERE